MFFSSRCLFHELTGLYCPGCGGTRAVWALLHGKFWLSFCYHPLVLYAAVSAVIFIAYLVSGLLLRLWIFSLKTQETLLFQIKNKAARLSALLLWGMLIVLTANFLLKNGMLLYGIDIMPDVIP